MNDSISQAELFSDRSWPRTSYLGGTARRCRRLGQGPFRLRNQLHLHHLLCKILLAGVLLAYIQAKQDPHSNLHPDSISQRLGDRCGERNNLMSHARMIFDPSLDPHHHLPVSACKRIVDPICADTVCAGQLQLWCQRQSILQWKLHSEHRYGRGTFNFAYAIYLAATPSSGPKARSK